MKRGCWPERRSKLRRLPMLCRLRSLKPENGNRTRWKPKTPEEKARYDAWLKAAVCRYCKQTGHIEVFCPTKLSKEKRTLLVSLSACPFTVMTRPGQKDTSNLMF